MHGIKGLTLSVRNLPPETTKHNIEGYFNGVVNGAEPFIGSLVKEPQNETMCATVTLNSEDACKKACAKLNRYKVWAPRGHGSYEIVLDGTFHGITPLAEHEDPQFDYYFVHGLGGHAFETFAAPIQKKHKHKEQKMWARDLLPEKFGKAGLRGRFSTLGYNANIVGRAGTTTIESAAKDLLYQLQLDRPEGCQRPIFFVAHSLGGLVVAQALILALDEDENQPVAADRLRLAGLVKGVVFMGTPFWGSFNATTLTPFVTALERVNPFPMNSGLLRSLSANSLDLVALASHFSQVTKLHKIEIKIFYESMALTSGLVTKPNSAAGPLDDFCDPIPINDNHIGMVKFGSSGDPKFRNVGEFLRRLTEKHVGGGGVFRASTFDNRPPSYTSASAPGDMLPGLGSHGRPSQTNDYSSNGISGYPDSAYDSTVLAQVQPPKRANTDHQPLRNFSMSKHHVSKTTRQLPHRPGHSAESSAESSAGPSVLAVPESVETTGVTGRENRRNLSRLAEWDVVFVIDDTNSMDTAADSVAASQTDQRVTTRWDVLVRAMQYIANVAAKHDEDGVDVYFLCSNLKMNNVTNGQQILDQLKKVNLEANIGGTFFERALSPILQAYMSKYKQYFKSMNSSKPRHPPKPMNIIVVTDGKADDGLQTENLIIRVAKELDEMYAPSYQLGIQFVQVGDDEKATKYLKVLDDRLENKWGIRDMVDTSQFVFTENGRSLGNKIVKILLAAMDKALDNEDAAEDDGPEEEEEEEDPYANI